MFTKSISRNIDHDFLRMKRDDTVRVLGLWVKDTLAGAVSVEKKIVDCKTAFSNRETRADRPRCARLAGARARI